MTCLRGELIEILPASNVFPNIKVPYLRVMCPELHLSPTLNL
jgi:hypothetical protein